MKKMFTIFVAFVFGTLIGLIVLVVIETVTNPVASQSITEELRFAYKDGFTTSLQGKVPNNPYTWDELQKRGAWFSGYVDHMEFMIVITRDKQFHILLGEIKQKEKEVKLGKPCGKP